MLIDAYNLYLPVADSVPNWREMSTNELMNKCLEYQDVDKDEFNKYFACVMIRYWWKICKFQARTPTTGLQLEEYVPWLSDAILKALKYHYWTDPKHENDPQSAEKAITRCGESMVQIHFYNSNLLKNKANFGAASLNAMEETGYTPSATADDYGFKLDCSELISNYVNAGNVYSALVLDAVLNADVLMSSGKLSKKKLNTYLCSADVQSFIADFAFRYCLSNDQAERAKDKLRQLQALPSDVVNRRTNSAIELLKSDDNFRSLLC